MPDPRPPAHDAPVDQPGSRRVGNLSVALRQTMVLGPITRAEASGIAAAVVVVAIVVLAPFESPWLFEVIIAVGLGGFVGTEVATRAIPTDTRRALEAFGFLGEWELDRAREVGTIATPDDARRWLASHPEQPDDRWFRWEALLLDDRPTEAAEVAARIEPTTPYDAFERAYALERIAWSQGAPSGIADLRPVAEAAGPPGSDDRRHAEVALAVAEGKDLAAEGRDPRAPLVAVRETLPADLGLGRRYVTGLRSIVLLAAIVAALVLPAAGAFVLTLAGRAP